MFDDFLLANTTVGGALSAVLCVHQMFTDVQTYQISPKTPQSDINVTLVWAIIVIYGTEYVTSVP